MKGMTFTLQMEQYMRQWLIHSLGEPVAFPPQSYENSIILRYISKRTEASCPAGGHRSDSLPSVEVIIPDSNEKPSEFYHHMGRRGCRALVAAIDNLFRLDLWSACAPQIHSRVELNSFIDEWCERHGIDLDFREAVRQKFYRMRKSYREKGIILGKFHKKRYHETGKKRTRP